MSTYTHDAKKQLKENKQLFGHPDTNPERFNLYNALINICDAIEDIENKQRETVRTLHHLAQR